MHDMQSSVFPYFLSALPLPKLYDKETTNFPTHSLNFLISKGVKVASAMLCSLIKHAVSASQSMHYVEIKKKIFRNIQQDNRCHVNTCTTCDPYIADIMPSQAGHH